MVAMARWHHMRVRGERGKRKRGESIQLWFESISCWQVIILTMATLCMSQTVYRTAILACSL
jgi:hypothetical protein